MNTFKVLCVYNMMLVLLKWNSKMLVKWLSGQFWRCCSCIYVLIIEMADTEITMSTARTECSRKKNSACAEHAGFIFKSTFAALYLQKLVNIAIWFKCNDLLSITLSKLWQSLWHSALNCKFRFYDWIAWFRDSIYIYTVGQKSI